MMFKNFNPFFVSLMLILVSCGQETKDYTRLVDVFIGTQDDGNTFPGVSVPFGGVQLSPDTRLDPKAHKAYSYSDSLIYGFSHTHLNGVGEPEYKDVLFMPFSAEMLPLDPDNNFFSSSFSHKNEHAGPGYYSVKLNNGIKVDLTATTRCGFHKYTFSEPQEALFIDLSYPDGAEDLYLRKVSDREIEGMRRSHGWAYDQYVYFVARFSKSIDAFFVSDNGKFFAKKNSARSSSLKA
jgi:putative alpha-1,2-mannosidase